MNDSAGGLLVAAHCRSAPDATLLLGALPVAVVLLDRDNRFHIANQAEEQFLGISVAQIAQLSLSDLIPADNPLFLLIEQL
ncbi:MAG: PAS domain-containing protein, partial [Acetobacteraceae bacterium]